MSKNFDVVIIGAGSTGSYIAKLLSEKGIESTLYLGCKLDENNKMIAHAWIRVGKMFVTGGNGAAEGYAIVDRFKARIKK